MSFAHAGAGMPKLAGLLVAGPAALLGVSQHAKLYPNVTITDEQRLAGDNSADQRRKLAFMDFLDANLTSFGNGTANHLEKTMMTNSALPMPFHSALSIAMREATPRASL